MKSDFRSALGKAKGLGSSGGGVHHWIMQRITAVALIPLVFWFIIIFIRLFAAKSEINILDIFVSPVNAIFSALMIVVMFYHASLGVRVIVEDYIHNRLLRTSTLLFVDFLTFITAMSGVGAVITLHLVAMN